MRDICSQNGNYFQRMKIKLMPWSVYIYIYDIQLRKWNYLIKLLELLKLILTKHKKIPEHVSKTNLLFLLCSQHEFVLADCLYLPSFRRARSRFSSLRGYFCRLCIYTDRWTILSECFTVAMRRDGNTMSAVNTSRLMAKRNK